VMDPICVFPTVSKEFPVIYHNPFTGKRHQLRPYQFMSLIDLPSVNAQLPGTGVCAVSRALWAAQEDRMIIRYAMEKMSENPGAGIGIVNTSTTALQTALSDAKAQREARGVVYYKGIIFLPVRDPSGSTKLEFLSFSGLPDNFDRSEVYNILKEIVATSFGLDVLELGTIPGRLGTATQAKVAAQKGRTRTIGAIMQGVERQFRYKLLPESLTFSIKKHDANEEQQRAEIDQVYFENATRLAVIQTPETVMQYLAYKGAVPSEPPFINVDLTPRETVQDTQSEVIEQGPEGSTGVGAIKMQEPRVRIDRVGKMKYLDLPIRLKQFKPSFAPVSTEITTKDVDRAVKRFDVLFPDLAGMLEAK